MKIVYWQDVINPFLLPSSSRSGIYKIGDQELLGVASAWTKSDAEGAFFSVSTSRRSARISASTSSKLASERMRSSTSSASCR
jgi:hypothetical protein